MFNDFMAPRALDPMTIGNWKTSNEQKLNNSSIVSLSSQYSMPIAAQKKRDKSLITPSTAGF